MITIDVNLHVGVMDNSRCDSVILKNVDVEGGKLNVDRTWIMSKKKNVDDVQHPRFFIVDKRGCRSFIDIIYAYPRFFWAKIVDILDQNIHVFIVDACCQRLVGEPEKLTQKSSDKSRKRVEKIGHGFG